MANEKGTTASTASTRFESTPIQLLVSDIEPSDRRYFKWSDADAISQSISKRGIGEPLMVRRLTSENGKRTYQVVDGDARLVCAVVHKLKAVPAVAADLSDEEAFAYREMLQRVKVVRRTLGIDQDQPDALLYAISAGMEQDVDFRF